MRMGTMSNWEKCFSTPEKTAETIEELCENAKYCGACPLAILNGGISCGDPMKWLDAEAGQESGCADCEIE